MKNFKTEIYTNNTTLIDEIPSEVLSDIFVRLCLNDILQCRYVCKTWFSIISDPRFANQRLNTITNHKDRIRIKKGLVQIYSNEKKNRRYVKLPFCDRTKTPEFFGSCNGLLLVGIGEKDHFLWNPYIGSYRQIPCEWFHFKEDDHWARYVRLYGLAYDSMMDTYKIIRIIRVTCVGNYDFTTVRVYNCKTECWKKIEDFPYDVVVNGQGTILNGVPHWIVTRKTRKDNEREYVIIYFDVVDDVFKEVNTCLPSWLVNGVRFRFGVMKESLCLVYNKRETAKIWITKDSKSTCWMKLVTIRLTDDSYCTKYDDFVFDDITKNFIPLRLRKNGEDLRFKRIEGKLKTKEKVIQGVRRQITVMPSNKLQECPPRNEVDIEDEIYSFDGPVSDSVFNTVTFMPSFVSPRF